MYRFAQFGQVVLMVAGLSTGAVQFAAAQEIPPAQPLTAASLRFEAAPFAAAQGPVVTRSAAVAKPGRPSALMPLYVTFGSLQAFDAHSTTRALNRGGAEANPLMRGIAGNPAAMLGVKAAGATAVVYAAERIWRRNRTASVVFMAAVNSAMALVVRHNYLVAGRR